MRSTASAAQAAACGARPGGGARISCWRGPLPRAEARAARCGSALVLDCSHAVAGCSHAAAIGAGARRAKLQPAHLQRRAARRGAACGAAGDAGGAGPLEAREDDVLPDSLFDAVIQAGEATAAAINNGTAGSLVEVLVPELWDPTSGNIMRDEGDQQRVWELTRFFVERLATSLGLEGDAARAVRAVYPDAGVAALLRNRWPDAQFSISSLNDRNVVAEGDRAVVVCAPDPQGVEEAERVGAKAAEAGVALVLINPRLASGDAGIGLNVRRMRERFMGRLTVTYCLRPVGNGTVYRRYPGQYQVFVADPSRAGRYVLAAETPARPAGEELMDIMEVAERAMAGGAPGAPAPAPGLLDNIAKTAASMARFMESLTR